MILCDVEVSRIAPKFCIFWYGLSAYPTGLGPGYIIIRKMNPSRGPFIKGRDGIDSQKADLFSGFFLRPCPNFYLADREFSLVISTPGPNGNRL